MPPADGDARLLSAALVSAALAWSCHSSSPPEPLRVAAAADLTVAFEELGKLFESRTGQKVSFSFGASGALAKQLTQGAPFDLFAAASPRFVESVVKSGACDGTTSAPYARGYVAAWSKNAELELSTLEDLKRPEVRHIAIANPEHAPYGQAAKEALTRAKLWPELEAKIVQAENVRQALEFAESGNADVAIVAESLIAQGDRGRRLAIDPSLYVPIEQVLVVCRHGHNAAAARELAKLIESTEGQALLRRHGFGASGEKPGQ